VAPSASPADSGDFPGPEGLAITIVWHPDLGRVGTTAALGRAGKLEVSRRTPPFDPATDVSLSRAPFLVVRASGRAAELVPTSTSTVVELDGRPLLESRLLSEDELRAGVILVLGGAIVVCLHFARSPALRGPPLGIVGGGDAIEGVRRQIVKVADLDVSVLIRGESGTGKELVARAIATAGKSASGPFVAINMAAIPNTTATDELFGHEKGAFTGAAEARPGYFLEADGGVLFLDEIGAASAEVQSMLLRVLETGEIRPLGARRPRAVKVRVVTATDEDLEAAVRGGRFSEPLLHRLGGYQIRLPALRERREDIGTLFVHFLRQELATVGESDRLEPREPSERPWLRAADMARIAVAPFPGNVRQLRNIARQLVISSRGQSFATLDATIESALAGGDGGSRSSADASTRGARATRVTDEEIRDALRRHNFNFSAAAEALGIHRSTLYDRVRQNPQDVRSASDLSDDEILAAHARHAGDIAAMAAELRVSPKPLKARLTEVLARRTGGGG
jgi:two-component system nitrogen regulation response regulator GlnG